jgi:hypothetical protein
MVLIKRNKPISRRLRFLVAAATIGLQLHLFFVTDLHRHNLPPAAATGQTKTTLRSAHGQIPPEPDPICSACRISHQGAVQLTAAAPLKTDDYGAGRVPATRTGKFDPQFLSHPSSRAPPLA